MNHPRIILFAVLITLAMGALMTTTASAQDVEPIHTMRLNSCNTPYNHHVDGNQFVIAMNCPGAEGTVAVGSVQSGYIRSQRVFEIDHRAKGLRLHGDNVYLTDSSGNGTVTSKFEMHTPDRHESYGFYGTTGSLFEVSDNLLAFQWGSVGSAPISFYDISGYDPKDVKMVGQFKNYERLIGIAGGLAFIDYQGVTAYNVTGDHAVSRGLVTTVEGERLNARRIIDIGNGRAWSFNHGPVEVIDLTTLRSTAAFESGWEWLSELYQGRYLLGLTPHKLDLIDLGVNGEYADNPRTIWTLKGEFDWAGLLDNGYVLIGKDSLLATYAWWPRVYLPYAGRSPVPPPPPTPDPHHVEPPPSRP